MPTPKLPSFLALSNHTSTVAGPPIAKIINNASANISDESLLKITRQLEFWHDKQHRLSEKELIFLAERLVRIATWRANSLGPSKNKNDKEKFSSVPKVRFGRTELQMPIITCGGMRIQEAWTRDDIPSELDSTSKSKILKHLPSQKVLKNVISSCLKVGINHFETSRSYGTAEMQFVNALVSLMKKEEGRGRPNQKNCIRRSDFIFQTKCDITSNNLPEFIRQWKATWSNVKDLGYIDLFSFHGISDDNQVGWLLNDNGDNEDGIYSYVKKLQQEGFIKHIGFSSHGPAENIMKLITSNKFSFVNLHKHFFGDYHAEGTPDGLGGHGNSACVKKALELDMGVFNISTFDKGGKLYCPSEIVASTIGVELSPISFAALHAWKTQGIHTVSVGFTRASDLDEVIEAARLYSMGGEKVEELLKGSENRLRNLAIEKLGQEWYEKGLLNIPSCYSNTTHGLAIGHILSLYNCMQVYGMYDFCKERYTMLERTYWSKDLSYRENMKNMKASNAGRSFDKDVDLSEALKDHYDPELAKANLAVCHSWLNSFSIPSNEKIKARGWKKAYDLAIKEPPVTEEVDKNKFAVRAVIRRIGFKTSSSNDGQSEEARMIRLTCCKLSMTGNRPSSAGKFATKASRRQSA